MGELRCDVMGSGRGFWVVAMGGCGGQDPGLPTKYSTPRARAWRSGVALMMRSVWLRPQNLEEGFGKGEAFDSTWRILAVLDFGGFSTRV